MTAYGVRVERKSRPADIEIKAPRVEWDENLHPRDRHGRFIMKGARVRLWGGTGDGTVERNLGGGFLEVLRDADDRRIRVHQNYMDVIDKDATTDARKAPEVPVEDASDDAVDAHENEGLETVAKPVYAAGSGAESDGSPATGETEMRTPETTLNVWRGVLAEEAADLDLTDPEDRAAFRQRIAQRTTNARVSLVRDLARDLGATDVPTTTSGASRALAETYIAQQTAASAQAAPMTTQAVAEPDDEDFLLGGLFDEDPPEAGHAADDAGKAARGEGDPDPEPEDSEVYTPKLEWDLDLYDFGVFVASIDKANRRAERAGIPHRFSYTTEQYERSVTHDRRTGVLLPVPRMETRTKVTLNRPTVEHDGWRFVATLSWDDEAGLVTRMAGDGHTLRDRPEARKCDVCKSVRDRKDTYVVQRGTGADMEEIQVGSNCLTQFLGIRPEGLWMLGFEPEVGGEDGEERERAGGGGESRWPVQNVLALSLAVANSRGWVSRSAGSVDGVGATADSVSAILHGRTESGGRSPQSQAAAAEENAWRREMADSIPAWMDEAKDLTDFARTLEGDSEYAINMRAIAGAESVSERNLGLLVSAVASRMARRERENRDAALANSKHFGEVGEKIKDVKARVTMVRPIEGQYGTTYLYTLVTEDGNVAKWFASREQDVSIDDMVTVSGTIKGHGEFRGVQETNITRAKLARTAESQAAADAKAKAREEAEKAREEEERLAYEQAHAAVPGGFTPWDGSTDLPPGTKVRVRKDQTIDPDAEYRGEYVEARLLTEPVTSDTGVRWAWVYVPAYGAAADGEMTVGFEIQSRPVTDIVAIAPSDDQNLAAFRAANPDLEAVLRIPPGFIPAPTAARYGASREEEQIVKDTIAIALANQREVRLAYQGRYVNGRITFVSPDSANPTIRVDVPGVGEVQATLGMGGNQVVAVRVPERKD